MTHILVESAWWLFVTQINAGAWLSISGVALVHWMLYDAWMRLF